VWTENSASVIRRSDGTVSYLVGEVLDITERKMADEALSTVTKTLLVR